MNEYLKSPAEPFEAVFHKLKDRTYDFAYRMLNDRETARDVTQEAFIKLFEHQNNSSDIKNVQSWLFILTRNLCLNMIRDSKKEVSLEEAVETDSQYDSRDPLPTAQISTALAALETGYREALILREYERFSYQEMSEILGLSLPAVKSLLFRARTRLREVFFNVQKTR